MSSASNPPSSSSSSSSSSSMARINQPAIRQSQVSRPPPSRNPSSNSNSNSTSSLANSKSSSMRGININNNLKNIQGSSGKNGGGGSVSKLQQNQQQQQQQQQQRREEEDSSGNIQVVVRVRGRAPGEPPSTSSILSTSGPRGSQIHVATDPTPVSSSSIQPSSLTLDSTNPPANEKTYSFDSVFGPEADQHMVHQSVVGPILEEVMSGYNCTIFAYGQTGTGKTHTMEGNLAPQAGTFHSEAGIIPRTLYRLFRTLEGQTNSEYAVRASYVELYNEELRDLLSPDLPQTTNANGTTRDGPPGGLKMYEDSKGKGVIIQGLEETPMRDAEDGVNLLRRGSQKRQIAATRCNENSSRSHSVFTLTIHIKETSSKGEDIIRIGKLNLVDLAGSENIGRSGAENKRAREAGMINQSLLTLGRVINALVEKNAHVPYRESKLTRLLQESLGGRTKTCIIATVSEDKANFEETLSTLDYALRAKSIRNRPEMNTRMTRTALIKEYVHEIERLKSDLLASRSQTGIYLSDESWRTTQEDVEANRATAERLRREKEVVESKFSSLEEQFEQSTHLLGKRENECMLARKAFDEKAEELKSIISKIDSLEREEEEQRSLKEAYQQSEKRLGKLAEQLRDTAVQSTSDVGGLFAKLERKSNVEASNRQVVADCQKSLSSMTSTLNRRIQTFGSAQSQFSSNLTSSVQEFANRQSSDLDSNISNLAERLSVLSEAAAALSGSHSDAKVNSHSLAAEIDQARESLLAATHERTTSLREACSVLAREVVEANGVQLEEVKECFSGMAELMKTTLRSVESHVAMEEERISEASEFIHSSAERQIVSLRQQNEVLASMLLEERERSKKSTEELGQNIMQMLRTSSKERDDRLALALGSVQQNLTSSEQVSRDCVEGYNSRLDQLSETRQSFLSEAVGLEKKARKHRKKGDAAAAKVNQKLGQDMQVFTEKFERTITEEEEECKKYSEDMGARMTGLRGQSDAAFETQDSELRRLMSGAREGFGLVESGLQQVKAELNQAIDQVIHTTNDHQSSSSAFIEKSSSDLASIQSETHSFLSTRFAQDVPTGETPIKREYNIRQSWNLVPKEKEAALARARARRRAAGQEGAVKAGDVESGMEEDLEGGSVNDKGSEVGSIAESDEEGEDRVEEEKTQEERYDETLDDTFADATIDASPIEGDRTALAPGPTPRFSLASRGSSASSTGNLAPRSRQVSRQVSTSVSGPTSSRVTGSSEEVSAARSTRARIASNALKEGDPNVKRRSSDEALPLPQNLKSKVKNPIGMGLPASNKRVKQ